MYKVMIIDDEEMIRWGVHDLLNWEEEGFVFCEDGKDGKDGLKKLLAYNPDLALVDIKMPGMSGLELIGKARAAGYGGCFIILTGYGEFEFAKQAIRHGVKEYLLKPIEEDELKRCVENIREELNRKEGERVYHCANENIAREELLRRILLQMEPKEELEEKIRRYQIPFGEKILCAAVLTDRNLLTSKEDGSFQEKVNVFLQDRELYQEKVVMDNQIILIGFGLDYRTWVALLKRRNEWVKKRLGEGLLLSVGHNVNQWYDLCYSYEFARFLLEQDFLFGRYDVLSIDTIEQWQENIECPSPEQFILLIEVGDLKGIEDSVKKFEIYCRKTLMKEMDIKIRIMYNLMTIRNNIEKKYGSLNGQIMELMEKMNRSERLEHLMDMYCQVLQDVCRQIGNDDSATVIKRMYYYMEKNYDKDLKVESFAKMFNYNSSYLGKIFRKEMGESFNNILDTIRIINAKRLLLETDMKVYQISEQVGYSNIDYFYLKFKKYVGVSPKEYKREKTSDTGLCPSSLY